MLLPQHMQHSQEVAYDGFLPIIQEETKEKSIAQAHSYVFLKSTRMCCILSSEPKRKDQ